MSVPSWEGLPQPRGGFPLPSDSGCVARQNVPSILAHSMPQCVYSWYGLPRSTVCEPQPGTTAANVSTNAPPILIRPHYDGGTLSSTGQIARLAASLGLLPKGDRTRVAPGGGETPAEGPIRFADADGPHQSAKRAEPTPPVFRAVRSVRWRCRGGASLPQPGEDVFLAGAQTARGVQRGAFGVLGYPAQIGPSSK